MALEADGAKTVQTALELLHTLRPRIAEILGGETSVVAKLDSMDILKGANVLYVGPSEEGTQLRQLCGKFGCGFSLFILKEKADLVHDTFRDAQYLTDTRPLVVRALIHCLMTTWVKPYIVALQHPEHEPSPPTTPSTVFV